MPRTNQTRKKKTREVDYQELYRYLMNKQFDAVNLLLEFQKVIDKDSDVDTGKLQDGLTFLRQLLEGGHVVCEEVVMSAGKINLTTMKSRYMAKLKKGEVDEQGKPIFVPKPQGIPYTLQELLREKLTN